MQVSYGFYTHTKGQRAHCPGCQRELADGEPIIVIGLETNHEKGWYERHVWHFHCATSHWWKNLMKQCSGRPPADLVPERRRGRHGEVVYVKRPAGDKQPALDTSRVKLKPVGRGRYIVVGGK